MPGQISNSEYTQYLLTSHYLLLGASPPTLTWIYCNSLLPGLPASAFDSCNLSAHDSANNPVQGLLLAVCLYRTYKALHSDSPGSLRVVYCSHTGSQARFPCPGCFCPQILFFQIAVCLVSSHPSCHCLKAYSEHPISNFNPPLAILHILHRCLGDTCHYLSTM